MMAVIVLLCRNTPYKGGHLIFSTILVFTIFYLHFVLVSEGHLRNCTPPAIDDFPAGIFTELQRQHGAIVVHAFISIYLFLALAVVCDKFFVPAVEKICHGTYLSEKIG